MNSRKTICIRCRGNHASAACVGAQPVVQLLEEATLEELYEAWDRQGYATGPQAVAMVRLIRASQEREREALA